MGSTGSGRFSDYPGGRTADSACDRAFSASLEEVEHCDYYKSNSDVPPVGTVLDIVQKKRIVAQTQAGEVVGCLPTHFNYLAGCLKQGYKYTGTVRTSKGGSVAVVAADFAADTP